MTRITDLVHTSTISIMRLVLLAGLIAATSVFGRDGEDDYDYYDDYNSSGAGHRDHGRADAGTGSDASSNGGSKSAISSRRSQGTSRCPPGRDGR
jgi:hypothetical protein